MSGFNDLEGADAGRAVFRRSVAGPVRAALAALDAFLRPHSIAVVGASTDPNTIAGLLFANLVDSHFGGVVLPVNKKHPTVQGIAAYPDLASCPVVPDLVIVCVPASPFPGVVAQAGVLGVKAVCVISAGFAETGKRRGGSPGRPRAGGPSGRCEARRPELHGDTQWYRRRKVQRDLQPGSSPGQAGRRFSASRARSGLLCWKRRRSRSGDQVGSYRSATAPILQVTSCSCTGVRIPPPT